MTHYPVNSHYCRTCNAIGGHTSPDCAAFLQQFTGSEILDALVRRVGPAEAVLRYNERFGESLCSVAELRAQLID